LPKVRAVLTFIFCEELVIITSICANVGEFYMLVADRAVVAGFIS